MTDATPYSDPASWDRELLRRRAAGFAIALLIEALLILALLSLGLNSSEGTPKGTRLVALDIAANSPAAPAEQNQDRPKSQPNEAIMTPRIPPPIIPSKNPIKLPPPAEDFIKVSKADFDDMDISKFPAGGSAGGSNSAAPVGPGEGPNGEPLYNAEWVREPSDAELGPYFAEAKARPAGAWAMIACKTIPRNGVENCQSLGESPRGSGLAKALRLAAWQFKVRAPRIGNKPMIGVWVRIRFDFRDAGGGGE